METLVNSYNAKTRHLIHAYRTTKLKLTKVSHNLSFNYRCLQHNITPKYALIKIRNTSYPAQKTKISAQRTYIKNSIKHLHHTKNEHNKNAYNIHLQLSKLLHYTELEEVITHTNIITTQLSQNIARKHNLKIKHLIQEQKTTYTTEHTFHPQTINTTNTNFNKDEIALINKGLKHNIQHNNITQHEIIDTETSIQNTHPEHHEHLRQNTQKYLHPNLKQRSTRKETQTLKSIKEKQKENNLTFIKADKGNCTVIMNNDVLNDKIETFFTENNITEIKQDPTPQFQSTIKNIINKSEHVIPKNMKQYLKHIKPQAPTLNALPKIHKPNIPIRPLINYTTSPAYKLSKHMDKIIRSHITFKNHSAVRDTIHLVETIKNTHIPHNSTLASFDITNLYTNIPIAETLEILENMLKQNNTPQHTINEIINITNTITKQNYFTHNNKYYTQQEGLPMGSPISCILAEIFIHNIEQTHILNPDNNKQATKILYWHRYVDDILCLYNGNTRQITQIHNHT